jgi:hypothetical protein
MNEDDWTRGNRAAWAAMLAHCLVHLGIEDAAAGHSRWVLEREETVAALRQACEDHGDNDWPDDLNLADVIRKHLANHLD